MAGARSLPLKELRAECRALETVVLAHKLATADDLAPHRPGGPANPDPGPRGWLRFYGVLHRFHAPTEHAAVSPVTDALAQLLTACTTAEPESVRLSLLDERGDRRLVQVYPKSRRALAWMHARDCHVQWLATGYRLLRQHATPGDVAAGLFERTAELYSYHLGVLIWAATTPGGWLPFNPAEERPDLPAWIDLLDPLDGLRVREAFRRVNERQIALLAHQIGGLEGRGPSSLPVWASCVVQIAEAQGVDPEVMDRDRAVVSILAGVFIRAKAHEEAEAAAQEKA